MTKPKEMWDIGPTTAWYQDIGKVFPPFEALSIGTNERQVAIIPLDDATLQDAQEICDSHNRKEKPDGC